MTKWHNQPERYEGLYFASQRERRRWQELQLLLAAGLIANLRRQVRYKLIVNGTLITTYVADFVYDDRERAAQIIEDAKGARTREYAIKARLMQAVLGLTIQEV